jgi:16S rRNA processing protein RimM
VSGGAAQRWLAVARILRPRGNKGEVAAELLTDFAERLAKLVEVFVGDAAALEDNSPRRVGIKSCWIDQNHPGQIVFHFEGCASIADAEKLRGLDVLLPFEQRVSLPAGQYFITDLIGCAVFEAARAASAVASSPCALADAPTLLGTVSDVQFTGEDVAGTPVLVVDMAKSELLIPLAEDICTRIDVVARRIEVNLPEGLRELNQP